MRFIAFGNYLFIAFGNEDRFREESHLEESRLGVIAFGPMGSVTARLKAVLRTGVLFGPCARFKWDPDDSSFVFTPLHT
jgi:hypothetical protein